MKKTEIQSASFQKLISAAAISMREAAESYATDVLSNISNPVPAAREMLIAEKLRELLSFEQDCLQLVSSWRNR